MSARLDELRAMRDFIDREIAVEQAAYIEKLRNDPLVGAVCDLYEVCLDDVLNGDRGHPVTRARRSIAWLLSRRGWSVYSLNVALGYVDRTSTGAAIRRVENDQSMRALLLGLEAS